jgi:hypothetical protein
MEWYVVTEISREIGIKRETRNGKRKRQIPFFGPRATPASPASEPVNQATTCLFKIG